MKDLRLCAHETMDTKPPVPYRPQEVWEQRERDGHMLPDRTRIGCQALLQLYQFACANLHLDTGCWGDLSLDGKRYFVVAGLRVRHEDKVMLVPFFIPVENKTGLTVSQGVFQLIDYIATCKQLQAFHGSKVLSILRDQD